IVAGGQTRHDGGAECAAIAIGAMARGTAVLKQRVAGTGILRRCDGDRNQNDKDNNTHETVAVYTVERRTAYGRRPIAMSWLAVRKNQAPSTRAGVASVCSPSRLTRSSLNSGPAARTNVSPSSFVKNTFPSTVTGDAEKPSRCASPRRPCHTVLPV